MSESVRTIQFEHFRGLPANEINLKGKNLALLGSNGKGKSAVVDGIEFLFSGQLSRFTGTGSGSIAHDDAITNVKTGGVPKVTIALVPSNGEISRVLESDAPTIVNRQAVRLYFDQHRGIGSFILRRAKILEFVCDQDADRYQKFVQLLGITRVDALQRSFVDGEREAKASAERVKTAHQTKLAPFNVPATDFEPKNLNGVFVCVSETIQSFGFEKLTQWSDAAMRLPLLKAMRPEANKERIDSITRALVSLETPLPLPVDEDVHTTNELRNRITQLAALSEDGPRTDIIKEGSAYLEAHRDETKCPLCEAPLDQSVEQLLSRLKVRSDALRELRETISKRKSAMNRIKRYSDDIAQQVKKDLRHSALLDQQTTEALRNARASAIRFSRLVLRAEAPAHCCDLLVPENLMVVATVRSACATDLKAQKAALVPPDSSRLEAAIPLLERGIASHEEIAKAEDAVASANELLRRAKIAKDAFSKARENAVQQVFDHIAETVLDYYKRLHEFEVPGERSECTALELKSTSRAAAGGLRLAIEFLGLANSKDPRAFMSEGHLDSLGLCLFLAAARIFNPPGSLLVLDDVLTSIDKEHRRRVAELMFAEFQDFQIIITTHDEHWHDLLCSMARAWGLQSRWQYMKIERWTVDSGPILSVVGSSWDFVTEHLNESDYRNLGGPFRLVLEDFLKRTAAKLDLKVKFRIDGKYTAGDFVTAGIQDKIRVELIKTDTEHETAICTDVGRVFGQGDLVNFLSHDNPRRLEITFDQAKDFVEGLQSLTTRCEEHKLIKGR